jgi:signal transduction histidine kinase
VVITGLRISGAAYPLPALGASAVPPLQLGADRNNIEIAYSAIRLTPGIPLQYEYRLEGADRQWTANAQPGSVNYANLAPGQYRFLARAVEAGQYSEMASVAFTIEPPLFRRSWFVALVLLTAGATAYAAHRYHLSQAVQLERVRMRIARDLHDDIGSSLSQIALLSEVARRDSASDDRATEPIARIGELAREVAESMSDLVWAINPQRDTLRDLASRMRRFANSLFEAQNIEVAFTTFGPGHEHVEKLSPDVRRELYLICKEALNNIAKHAGCTVVRVDFGIGDHEMILRIHDNGRGCGGFSSADGHGVDSMRSRAELLGGRFDIDYQPGNGTRVTVSIPFGAQRRSVSLPKQVGI